ncbi:threonylcarbamoyl-AMP synthase [Candidatus Peregrinibacteria bacterium CG_4_9_14_0_2_um_filter_53_11]|nr:MAG: threonylcarbamoyl-AMP synthase [Candidatus Peregrinibacteria bacterium CG_4_9_14_0_2_um_filter_53_11]
MASPPDQLESSVVLLKSGGVIAHPTDTCYGFACDISNKSAVERLYALKQMSLDKPVSILVADLAMARRYAQFSSRALKFAERYWPGPLTLVLPRTPHLPEHLNANHPTVGIRLPQDRFSRELARLLGGTITTTSANLTTQPSPYSPDEIEAQFASLPLKPDLIVDGGVLDRSVRPSTIIDLSGTEPRLLRQGAIQIDL